MPVWFSSSCYFVCAAVICYSQQVVRGLSACTMCHLYPASCRKSFVFICTRYVNTRFAYLDCFATFFLLRYLSHILWLHNLYLSRMNNQEGLLMSFDRRTVWCGDSNNTFFFTSGYFVLTWWPTPDDLYPPTHVAKVWRWRASLHTGMLVGGGWFWLVNIQRFWRPR